MPSRSLLSRIRPSARKHGAQRMFSATNLVLEAFVVFFAVLVAHQLVPGDRALTWIWGLATAAALLLCAGLLSRGAGAYLLGFVLQAPVVLLGLQVSAMWVVGPAFTLLYVYGVFKGHQLDREKDQVDRQAFAGRGEGDGPADGAADGRAAE